jgi:hypothetical protein
MRKRLENLHISLCPSWMVSAVSSMGKSGGLLVAWNPILFDLQPFICVGGILLTGIHLPDNKRISFINAYGSCSGRRSFWEKVEAKGLLSMDALILAGDLNFTTSFDEVWGVGALMDPLAGFFKELFAKNHLVDIQPAELCQLGAMAEAGVRGYKSVWIEFLFQHLFLGDTVRYRSWVELPFISDHAPVIFQMDYGLKRIAYPYKFNPAHVRDESFRDIVKSVWCANQGIREEGAQCRLVSKLIKLKSWVKKWIIEKKQRKKITMKS